MIKDGKIMWDETFRDAHLTSWPNAGLCTTYEIYKRDKNEIDKYAKKYEYISIQELTKTENKSIISFIKYDQESKKICHSILKRHGLKPET